MPELYITSVGSGGLGFGEENPPLDQPALGLGCGNPKPIVGASVPTEIGWRSGGLVGPAGHSRVWTPLIILYTYISSKKKKNKRIKFLSKLASLEINSLNFSYIYFLNTNFENLADKFHVPYVLNMYIKFHSN